MRRAAVFIAVLAALLAAAAPAFAAADDGSAPWRSAEALRRGLFSAQTELILGDAGAARRAADRAAGAYQGELRERIRAPRPTSTPPSAARSAPPAVRSPPATSARSPPRAARCRARCSAARWR